MHRDQNLHMSSLDPNLILLKVALCGPLHKLRLNLNNNTYASSYLYRGTLFHTFGK